MEDLEKRVLMLENSVEGLKDKSDNQKKSIESLHKDLQDIKRILSNIRNWAIGGLAVFLAQQVGIIKLIEKFF